MRTAAVFHRVFFVSLFYLVFFWLSSWCFFSAFSIFLFFCFLSAFVVLFYFCFGWNSVTSTLHSKLLEVKWVMYAQHFIVRLYYCKIKYWTVDAKLAFQVACSTPPAGRWRTLSKLNKLKTRPYRPCKLLISGFSIKLEERGCACKEKRKWIWNQITKQIMGLKLQK